MFFFVFIVLTAAPVWRSWQVLRGGGYYYDENEKLQGSLPKPIEAPKLKMPEKDGKFNLGKSLENAEEVAKQLAGSRNTLARGQYVFTMDRHYWITGVLVASIVCTTLYVVGLLVGEFCQGFAASIRFCLCCGCFRASPVRKPRRKTRFRGSRADNDVLDDSYSDSEEYSPPPESTRRSRRRRSKRK